jgi:hypothetical protein
MQFLISKLPHTNFDATEDAAEAENGKWNAC